MTDNNEKKAEKKNKSRLNIVDIIIIVAVVVCIAGSVLRVVLSAKYQADNMKSYLLTFQTDELSYAEYSGILQAFDEKDEGGNFISFSDKKERIGEIHGFTEKTFIYVESKNGENIYDVDLDNAENQKNIAYEDTVWRISGTIICSCVYSSDRGFLLNGHDYIAINSTIDVTTKYSEFNIKVLSIEEYK